MKHVNIPLEDEAYSRLVQAKGLQGWAAFLMRLVPNDMQLAQADQAKWDAAQQAMAAVVEAKAEREAYALAHPYAVDVARLKRHLNEAQELFDTQPTEQLLAAINGLKTKIEEIDKRRGSV